MLSHSVMNAWKTDFFARPDQYPEELEVTSGYWPVVWGRDKVWSYGPDPCRRPIYEIFGGEGCAEIISTEHATKRYREAYNIVHMGLVPDDVLIYAVASDGQAVDQSFALAARVGSPVELWLIDTGCGHDLIGRDELGRFARK